MAKWWHVSWKRVGLTLLIVFAAIGVLDGTVTLVMGQLRSWLVVREITKDNPRIRLVPAQLPQGDVVAPTGLQFTFHGFSIQVPWKDLEWQRCGDSVLLIAFKNGARVIVQDPPADDINARMYRSDPQLLRILGAETLQSDYAFMAAAVTATPDQAAWWRSPRQNARSFILLGMKSMNLQDASAIYPVSFGNVRGFQTGSPSVPPYHLNLDLFDKADRHYEIWIRTTQGSASGLSQAEVNGIVASLRPGPSPENNLIKHQQPGSLPAARLPR